MTIEPALDPSIPIIDAHHHLFDRATDQRAAACGGRRRFLIDQYLDGNGSAHNIVATVGVNAHAMYRADGPKAMRVVGETEFLNGQAAMAASGLYGPCRVSAAIVAMADLCLGEAVRPVLEAHMAAAPQRFRGIRHAGIWDEDSSIVGMLVDNGAHLYQRDDFRRGFAELATLGLSFDAFVLAPQLPDVVDLAKRFSGVAIILNHAGCPVGAGRYAGRRDTLFPQWRSDMSRLARCPNVSVKLGGLGTYISGFIPRPLETPLSSKVLAELWRPYLEACIELFGADRCMFESNYPTDWEAGSFITVWNALKRVAAGCSAAEQQALFSGTAARVYRIARPA